MKISETICAMAGLVFMLTTIGMAQSKGTFIDGTNKFTIILTEGWRTINYTDVIGRSPNYISAADFVLAAIGSTLYKL
jgi:hypothetical protein